MFLLHIHPPSRILLTSRFWPIADDGLISNSAHIGLTVYLPCLQLRSVSICAAATAESTFHRGRIVFYKFYELPLDSEFIHAASLSHCIPLYMPAWKQTSFSSSKSSSWSSHPLFLSYYQPQWLPCKGLPPPQWKRQTQATTLEYAYEIVQTVVTFTKTLFSIALFIMAILFATLPQMTGRITTMMIKSTGIAIRPLRQVSSLQVLRTYLTMVTAVLCKRQRLHLERRKSFC